MCKHAHVKHDTALNTLLLINTAMGLSSVKRHVWLATSLVLCVLCVPELDLYEKSLLIPMMNAV